MDMSPSWKSIRHCIIGHRNVCRHDIIPFHPYISPLNSVSTHLYNNPSTISPIAKLLVKPGLSIPKRFTKPSNPSSV